MTQEQIDRMIAEEAELASKIVFDGYTHGQLNAAFQVVQDKEHWKNPIDAEIDEADVAVTQAAIIFFAGSPSEVYPSRPGRKRIIADGYFVRIGA